MMMSLPRLKNKCFKTPLSIIFIILIIYVNYFYKNNISELDTKIIKTPQLNFQYSAKQNGKWKTTENSTNQNVIKNSANQNAIILNSANQKQRPVYVLWSRWRRGSSFVGKLLAYAKSKTFYSFEPLHALGLHVFRNNSDPLTMFALKFLKDIIYCHYEHHEYLVNYFVETEFYFFHNPLTKSRCSPVVNCNDTSLLNQYCHNSKLQVIKLLRLSLKYGEYLLKKYPQMKIIYLSRDPRGTLKSRSRLMWCLLTKDCHDPTTVCQLMQEDIEYSQYLINRYPKRFFFARYEDLSLNTESVFQSLWEALGEKFTPRIQRMINKHTTKDLENGIYGLKKNSKKQVFSWRSSLDSITLQKIQKSCLKPMTNLGYYIFPTEEEFENQNRSSLANQWDSKLNMFQ